MRKSLALAWLIGTTTFASVAFADRTSETTTTTPAPSTGGTTEGTPSPWRGSILLFDQSVTTQTIGLGKDYQSSNPTYEWWFALKPRYTYFQSEDKRTTMALNLWANLYLELTNSDSTTTKREPLLGPTFLSTSISQVLYKEGETKTSVNIGPRLTLPTDKESRNLGRLLGLGASAGVSQTVPLNGKDAPSFNNLTFGISTIYSHPIYKARQSVSSNSGNENQQTLGAPRTVAVGENHLVPEYPVGTDVFGKAMNTSDTLSFSLSAGAQLTPKLSLGLSYVISNAWKYWPTPSNPVIHTDTGDVPVQTLPNATNYRVGTWALASVDYDLLDEMSLGIGYYNQTNQIGPDGQRRSPLWSPDARVFFTLTGNLDAIGDRIFTKPSASSTQTASAK